MTKIPTRRKLIDTAIELIWRNSYGATSVDDMCRAAGVNKGSFYHYFKSKADLAGEAMVAHFEDMRPTLDEAFSPAHAPLQRLENLVALIINKQEQAAAEYGRVCGCPFSGLGSEMGTQDDVIHAKIQDIFARYDLYMASVLRDLVSDGLLPKDTDVQATLVSLRSYIMGMKMMARIENSLEGLRKDLRAGVMRIVGLDETLCMKNCAAA